MGTMDDSHPSLSAWDTFETKTGPTGAAECRRGHWLHVGNCTKYCRKSWANQTATRVLFAVWTES